MREKTAELGSI